MKLSSRQRKGLLTSILLLVAESVTLSNAVTFWSTYQKWSKQYGRGRTRQQSSSSCQGNRGRKVANRKTSSFTSNEKLSKSRCHTAVFSVLDSSQEADGGGDFMMEDDDGDDTAGDECDSKWKEGDPQDLEDHLLHYPARLFPRTRMSHHFSSFTSASSQVDCCVIQQCGAPCQKAPSDRADTTRMDVSTYGRKSHNHQYPVLIPRGGANAVDPTILTSLASASTVPTPYNIPLNIWKVLFQVCLTAINVFFWLVPLRCKKITESKFSLSLANAFSAGVFLCLAFGHLIPECVTGFHNYRSQQLQGGQLPSQLQNMIQNEALPYMLVLTGYLLIFFVEKIAFDADGALRELEHGQDTVSPTTIVLKSNESTNSNRHLSTCQTTSTDITESDSSQESILVTSQLTVHGHVASNDSPLLSSSSSLPIHVEPVIGISPSSPPIGRSAIVLLAALAVHSILEMTALGLANTFGDSALLSLSIALHQPAESIALLVAFLKSGMPQKDIITYLSVFSAMGPIGVAIGMAVNQFAAPIVDCIMLALVGGTFVYVGATEVIPEEWEDSEHKWPKFFALITGIVSIFIITQYTMSLEGL